MITTICGRARHVVRTTLTHHTQHNAKLTLFKIVGHVSCHLPVNLLGKATEELQRSGAHQKPYGLS